MSKWNGQSLSVPNKCSRAQVTSRPGKALHARVDFKFPIGLTRQEPLAAKRRDGLGYPARPARTSSRIAARIRLWPLMLPDRASVA
jgi:hypothetical protein